MLDLLFNLLMKLFKGTDLEVMLSPQYEWRESIKEGIINGTKRVLYILLGLVAAFSFIIVILWAASPNDSPTWTGFGAYINAKGEVERAKTLWDWMDLLVVSIVLAIGGFLLNQSTRRSERTIEEQRAKRERQRATDQQRQQILEKYLDKMGELLIDKGLRTSGKDEPHTVARARTLATLRSLGWGEASDIEPDSERRRYILQFLYESGLIERENVVVDLKGAELDRANLKKADLIHADLGECSLAWASLEEADLRKADLTDANMFQANLRGTNLDDALLLGTHMFGADLRGCHLTQADLTGSFLRNADLRNAHLERAVLRKADLSNANLVGASLLGADICATNFSEAKMEGAPVEEFGWLLEGKSKDEAIREVQLLALEKYLRADLSGAIYDERTKWPFESFDPQVYGAVKKE